MKSFVINLGRNHEVLDQTELINPVSNHPGNADACVKGYFENTMTIPNPGESAGISASLYINADVLKEYFKDVTGIETVGIRARVESVEPDNELYVIITPTQMG